VMNNYHSASSSEEALNRHHDLLPGDRADARLAAGITAKHHDLQQPHFNYGGNSSSVHRGGQILSRFHRGAEHNPAVTIPVIAEMTRSRPASTTFKQQVRTHVSCEDWVELQ
jgi:hypothetical protein